MNFKYLCNDSVTKNIFIIDFSHFYSGKSSLNKNSKNGKTMKIFSIFCTYRATNH